MRPLLRHLERVGPALLVAACGGRPATADRPPGSASDSACWRPVSGVAPPCMSPPGVATTVPRAVAWLSDPGAGGSDPRSPVGVAIADMDRDGNADVLVVRGGPDPQEHSSVEIHHGPFTVAADGASATAAALWSATPPGRPHLLKPTIADLDGDGCPELVVGSMEGHAYGSSTAAASTGPGRCARRGSADGLSIVVDDGAGAPAAALGQLIAADLDGDGHVDLAAARFAFSPPYRFRFVRPRIYWGPPPFSAAADRSWTPAEALAESFSVTAIHAAGAGGERVVAGVLFGASALATVERTMGDCEDEIGAVASGDVRLAWGAYYPRGAGRRLLAPSLFTQEPPGHVVGSYPAVMDIDELPSGNVFVTSSSHKCATCGARAVPREYAWSPAHDRLLPAAPAVPLPDGAWQVTGVGDVDGDAAADDVVLGRGCDAVSLLEGQIYVLSAPDRRPTILSLPHPGTSTQRSFLSRTAAVGTLAIAEPGGRITTRRAVVLGDTPILQSGRVGPGGRAGLVLLDPP